MKYVININHYTYGSGYSYTETFDSGTTEDTFTAKEWFDGLDEPFVLDENEWIEIVVYFYNDGDDPMFVNPVLKSTYSY